MKHSQLAANNSSSFRSSSIRRPSNSFRFFGISVIGKSSGVGVALLSTCFFLQGCAAGSSSNNPPLDPATVAIVAPASGAVVTALPVPITLNLMNGATLSGMKITLNGTDITGSFVAGNGNTAQASLSGRTYVGNNRIQVVIGSQTVKSQFTYNPGSTGTAGSMGPPSSGSSSTLSDVIPIQTRVQMTNELGQQTMGVQVGEAAYPAPGVQSNTTGFQVVWLRRSDLKMVSNASYSVVDDASATAFANEITPSATQVNYCGIAGCIEVIQSLSGIGYNPCFGDGNAIACVNYRLAFQNIGGTLIIPNVPQNDPGNLAYSFIGNIGSTGLHPGSSYERVTCASSDGCIQPTPPGSNSNTVLYGIAPNGVDGVMPNLANTGSSGTTTISATAFMPQMTISNNGAMAGEFVLDNTNNFTFAYADPPISFQMGVAPDNPNKNLLTLTIPSGSQMTFPNGSKTQAGESGVLPPNDNGAPVGGFHLVAFDAVTFKNLVNGTYTVSPFPSSCPQVAGTDYCIGPDGTPIYRLDQLQSDILRFNSRGVILFLASIGNLNHNYVWGSNSRTQYYAQDIWDRVAQAVQDIGGTYPTFVSLNNQSYAKDDYDQYSKDTVPQDDYTMVGQWWINDSGVANPYAAEESSQISRQTVKYPVPSNMQGLLEKENDGYYRAKLETTYDGLVPDIAVTLTSAPLLPPTPWPATSGPNVTSGITNAYGWISQQLLGCVTGCSDVRAAYTNLNESPAIWLALLGDLQIPDDCDTNNIANYCSLGFGEDDFDTVRAQLGTELTYLGVLREYQNNLLGLLQSEQANVGLILQQSLDQLTGIIPYQATSSYGYQNWRTDVEDGLKVAGALGGFASFIPDAGPFIGPSVNTVVALSDMGLDLSAKNTNDPYGRSLAEQEHDLVAGSQLAGKSADQYAQVLTSIGKDFERIASDWGRLQAVGQPLQNNTLVWSAEASGLLLNSFDVATRRGFLKKLIPAGFQVIHYAYAAPGVHNDNAAYFPQENSCTYYNFMNYQAQGDPTNPSTQQSYASYAYLPGAPIDGLGFPIADAQNTWPNDLWWDVWTMTDSSYGTQGCTNTSAMPPNSFFIDTGIFAQLDPADPTKLGMYKPWFYQRTFPNSNVSHIQTPQDAVNFWDNQLGGGDPFHFGSGPAAPNPDNY